MDGDETRLPPKEERSGGGGEERGRQPDLYHTVALDKFLRRLLWREGQQDSLTFSFSLALSLSRSLSLTPLLCLSVPPPLSGSSEGGCVR